MVFEFEYNNNNNSNNFGQILKLMLNFNYMVS